MACGYLTPVYPQLSCMHAFLHEWFSLSSPTKYNDNPLLQTKDFFPSAKSKHSFRLLFCDQTWGTLSIVLLTPTISNALFVWPHKITHPTLFPLFAGSVMLGFSLLFLPLTRWPLLPCFLPSDPKSLNLPLSFLPQPCTSMSSSQTVSQLWVCLSFHCISSVFSFFYLTVGLRCIIVMDPHFPFVLVRIPWKDYLSLNSSSFTLLFKSPFPYIFFNHATPVVFIKLWLY